ncbi:MAG TPA: DUF1800 domain-containing protein [Acidimicrobiales bacterium]|nr:DUF1800 domain-containing protein [Acidimicrobiales bacterium]
MDTSPADLRSRIAHLYRRAGFGARPDELDAAVAAGYQATVDRLCDLGAADPAADALPPPKVTPYTAAGPADQAARQTARRETVALSLWWLDRMVVAQVPLREKLALMWHSHFATSVQKVKDPGLMLAQNQALRTLGGGNFLALARGVVEGAAMLVYLDANQNRKASPNENLSRELMELFTLGIGNYTEGDVKEGARGLTGLMVNRQSLAVNVNKAQHDDGAKTYLGKTAAFAPDDIVATAATSPASATYVAAKVWGHFARPAGPGDPVVAELAAGFAKDPDIGRLVKAVFLHPEFVTPATRTGLVKQPIEYVAGALRAVGRRAGTDATLVAQLTALGQAPFQPPDVGGWPQNTYWLNTSFSLARLRFASALAGKADVSSLSSAAPADRPAAAARLLSVDGWGPSTAAALAGAAGDPRALLTLALVAPEYVLA